MTPPSPSSVSTEPASPVSTVSITSSHRPTSSSVCLCHHGSEESKNRRLCSSCVKRALHDAQERRLRALQQRDAARAACAQRLPSPNQQQCTVNNVPTNSTAIETAICLTQLQDAYQQGQRRLTELRAACTRAAVQLTSQAVHNQQRQEEQQQERRRQAQQQQVVVAPTEEPQDATLMDTPLRQQVAALRHALQDEGMMHTVAERRQYLRALRYSWALAIFRLHRISVEDEAIETTRSGRRKISGIGKIAGLPVPHAGPDLYSVLPAAELTSALRLVASVTVSVAQCLGICLPHAISTLSTTSATNTTNPQQQDLAELQQEEEGDNDRITATASHDSASTTTTARKVESSSSSSSHLTSNLMGTLWSLEQGAKKVLASAAAVATGQDHHHKQKSQQQDSPFLQEAASQHEASTTTRTRATLVPNATVPLSNHPARVQERIRYSVSAVLSEDNGRSRAGSPSRSASTSSSRYALLAQENNSAGSNNPGSDDHQQFPIALQLLQNDIIALCIRAGVPVAKLAPAQAVLLNLQALQEHCQDQLVMGDSGDSAKRSPSAES